MLKSVTRVSEVTPYFGRNLLIGSSSPHAPTSSHLRSLLRRSPAELCWSPRWIRRPPCIWRDATAWITFAFAKVLWKRWRTTNYSHLFYKLNVVLSWTTGRILDFCKLGPSLLCTMRIGYKLAKLGDARAISKSETMNDRLTDPLTDTDTKR